MLISLAWITKFMHSADDLPPGERLVIGLNPPFGKQNTLADK